MRKGAAYALVLVLTVELALWGAFLTGARPFGYAFPLAAVVAVVGNVVLGRAGERVLGRRVGAAIPGVVWLVIAVTLGTTRSEGDLVVRGDFRGLAFLVLGAVAATAAVGATPSRPPRR
jgi:hypothetical protein